MPFRHETRRGRRAPGWEAAMSPFWMTFLMLYPPAMFIAALLAIVIAPKKGRDSVWWGVFCFLLPPLFILLLILPSGTNWGGPPKWDEDDMLDHIN
jgi:hypothetical protein